MLQHCCSKAWCSTTQVKHDQVKHVAVKHVAVKHVAAVSTTPEAHHSLETQAVHTRLCIDMQEQKMYKKISKLCVSVSVCLFVCVNMSVSVFVSGRVRVRVCVCVFVFVCRSGKLSGGMSD